MGRDRFRPLPRWSSRVGSDKVNGKSFTRVSNPIVFLCSFYAFGLGGLACQSTPTRAEAVRVVGDLDSVDAIIKSSNIPEAQKKDALAKTENAKKLVVEQSQTITEQTEQIATLSKYKHYVWAFCAALGLSVVGVGLWLARKVIF